MNSDGTNDHPQGELANLRTWQKSLHGFRRGSNINSHGEHVAGIIGAAYNNGVGVDGINPLVAQVVSVDDHFIGVSLSGGAAAPGLAGWFAPIVNDLKLALGNWPVVGVEKMVVNISLGYNWGSNTFNRTSRQSIDPTVSAAAQQVAAAHGLLVRQIVAGHPNTIIVAAAGNDSQARRWGYNNEIDAKWASPFNWAAMGPTAFRGSTAWPRSPNILVVESVDAVVANPADSSFAWQYTKSDFSNVGGDVAAPGGRILSTVGNNIILDNDNDGLVDEDPIDNPRIDDDGDGSFDEDPINNPPRDDDGDGVFDEDPSIDDDGDGKFDEDPVEGFSNYVTSDGTSMAAPHVTGLIGYLLTLEPDLTVAQIRTLITQPQYTRTTQLLPNEVYPATIVNQSPAPMIDAFAAAIGIDVVTGDADKSIQRVLVDVDDGTDDGNLRVDPFTGAAVDAALTADDHRGDGHITMRDFRAWRDAYLQTIAPYLSAGELGVALGGAVDHVKKDLNFNGAVTTTDELLYPRYDFNGDGSVLAWSATAPFKIDPDTPPPPPPPGAQPLENKSPDLQSSPGFLRDIDVLADPAFWTQVETDLYNEGVTLTPASEGVGNANSLWSESRYLLANRDPASASAFLKDLPDYIHSFDLHVSIDWTALDYGHDALLLRIDSEQAGPNFAERFSREAIVPTGTADFVVTIPLWTGNVQVRFAGFDSDAVTLPNLDLVSPRGFSGLAFGDDLPLKIEAHNYTITNFNDLLAPFGVTYSSAAAINNLGDVVLETNYPGSSAIHLFLVEHSSGVITHLNPLIGGYELGASDINDSRQIAGTRYDQNGEIVSGFIYQYGETPSLTELGPRHKPLDINDAGDVVGYIYNPTSDNRGFVRNREGTIELPGNRATGINNHGDIVGVFDNGAELYNYLDGRYIDIGLPPGQTSGQVRDFDINDAGQIAGAFSPPSGPFQPTSYTPFIWEDGIWSFPLRSPFGGISYFGGLFYDVTLNESGVLVGNTGFMVFDSAGSYYAWRFDVSGGNRLSDLDPPNSPFSKIDEVGDINDRGDIVGAGILPLSRRGGFVLRKVL